MAWTRTTTDFLLWLIFYQHINTGLTWLFQARVCLLGWLMIHNHSMSTVRRGTVKMTNINFLFFTCGFLCSHFSNWWIGDCHQKSTPQWSGNKREIKKDLNNHKDKRDVPQRPGFMNTSVLVFLLYSVQTPRCSVIVAGTPRTVDNCERSTCLERPERASESFFLTSASLCFFWLDVTYTFVLKCCEPRGAGSPSLCQSVQGCGVIRVPFTWARRALFSGQ